jgi:Uma2 family endonuclease
MDEQVEGSVRYERPVSRQQYLVRELVAEYRSELHEGEIVAMAGASPDHQRIAHRISVVATAALDPVGCEVFDTDCRVRIPEENYYYPDVVFVCDPIFEPDEPDSLLNPLVVVEVLSPSTEERDRNRNLRGYMRVPSIEEIVLASSLRRKVEVYRRNGLNWECWLFYGSDSARLTSCPVVLDLDEIYARTTVPRMD